MQVKNVNKRPIIDLIYSFTAYALPTFTLQFVILPLIAGHLSADDNGLFLALFNTVRLCVSLFILPLSNIRLLKKKECINNPHYDKRFNFLFLLVVGISSIVVLVLGLFYYQQMFDFRAMFRLISVLVLLSAHDYYSITFRIEITYKSILIDNLIIVLGYILGIFLMWRLGYWELIFISGYLLGLIYTLIKSKLWRCGIDTTINKNYVAEYSQLSISSGLNNATTYCDKMLIYPLIGGYSVSVYNAATVVSKMMSLVSVPLRNVFLSYIVDADTISVSRKKRKNMIYFVGAFSILIYVGFYITSIVFCRLLYPKYFEVAMSYIPIVLLAILFETYAGLLKVYLLRFENTMLQVITSCVKVALYLLSVLIMNVICKWGLNGFCLSILIADSVHFVIVLIYFIKNIKKQIGGKQNVS